MEQEKQIVFANEYICVLESNEEGKRSNGKSDLQGMCINMYECKASVVAAPCFCFAS